MAKKPTRTRGKHLGFIDEDAEIAKMEDRPVDEAVYAFMLDYGVYTLENRAIPSVEDGLMPVQRRTVWAMKQLGLNSGAAYLKHATIIGETMGRYHPHGDSSIYGAGVRLASGTPAPIIQGSGNWGTYNTTPAAMRYHEGRPSKLCDNVYLDNYYLRATDYTKNFDGSREEPVVLPAKIPMVLAIEQEGIAVGVTTHIPAFTVDSITKITKYMFGGGKVTARYLQKHLEFTSRWGGKVVSPPEQILEFMNTGIGSIQWVCDYTIDGNTITVTGIPPSFNFDNRLESINERIPGVASAFDQSDKKNPVKMVITLKRGSEDDKEKTIAAVEKYLTNNITYRVNVVRRQLDETTIPPSVKSELVAMSIVDVFEDWKEWRLEELEKAALKAEEADLVKRLSRLELLCIAIDNLDIIFKILKTKGIDKKVELAKKLKITEEEAQTIWELSVGRLDSLSLDETEAKIREVQSARKQIRKDIRDLGTSALRRSNI